MNLEEITKSTANAPSDLMDLEETLLLPQLNDNYIQWAFRGQPRTYGTLVPSFQRVFGEKRSVRTAHLIEENLIKAFREHYGKLSERSSGMPDPSKIKYGFDLRCLSVMQHYGVPTRLLDWSTNIWTAVFFACTGDPNEDAELWMYDRSIFDFQDSWSAGLGSVRGNAISNPPLEPTMLSVRDKSIVFETDPKLTPRMAEQMGHHTICTDVFADHAPALYQLAQDNPEDPEGIRRIIIAKGAKEKTLRFLDEQMGVTASTIFPDVEGLGRFLRWQLDSLLTTLL
jgi:hypothetical protein